MLAEFIKLPKEGETIGPYLLRETLSTSILGAFYQATHKLKHENVLLHILPEALLRADARFQQRYKEVIERQKRLPTGPAMGALELHRISGNLVVQYPAGNYKSMNDVVLKRKDPLPEERVKQMVVTLAKGLSDALKLEQGHFFLTPDFLFLNEDGEIRMAGLGLFQSIQYECFERFVSGAVMPISVDKERSFSALEILSPEIRNFKSRDLRSDFYCLGMCAYFMLTGEKPLRRWATPTKTRKELAEGWDLFISRCLEPKPTDRFPNYKAFLYDIEHLDELEAGPKGGADGRVRRKLSRLPLPQGVEKMLSMRNLLFVRLVLLGLAGVLTIGTASMLFEIIYSDYGEEVSDHPIRRVMDVEQANMVIKVHPENAMVIVTGPHSGRFHPGTEPLLLKGRSGHYTIRAQAPRHRAVSRQVELNASEPIELKLALVPDFATIRITGAVGTEVYVLEGEEFLLHIGTIESADGLEINDRLLTGKHQLVGLHRSLLPALSGKIDMGNKAVEITFKQPPRPTELVVTSEPEGASVKVEGRILGLTPLRVEDLATGHELLLEVEKEGYRRVERRLFFEQGERIEISAGELEPKIGALAYNLDLDVPNAPELWELMISVDGTALQAQASGQLDLPEGEHVIRLEHPDYLPVEKTVMVLDRETAKVELELNPRPVRLRPVLSEDLPVRFFVNGTETALTEGNYLPIPANQVAKVEAVIRDHLSVIQSFRGGANERREWEVPLRPIPGPKQGEDWSPPYYPMRMAWLEPGSYIMGSPVREFRRVPNEDTTTLVTLSSGFWISIHEVTQGTYQRVTGENPSEFIGVDRPVDSVSWEAARDFCEKLTTFEREAGRLPSGYVYRLPTEAEWEYAARAGTETPFSFGDEATPEDGNFHGIYRAGETASGSGEERYGTLPVGSFAPNAFGLYDVHGNVAEWTLNRYWDRHSGGRVTDPANLREGRGYTVKGGSWEDTADRVRSAAREGAAGSSVRNSLGFRVVLAPLPEHNSR